MLEPGPREEEWASLTSSEPTTPANTLFYDADAVTHDYLTSCAVLLFAFFVGHTTWSKCLCRREGGVHCGATTAKDPEPISTTTALKFALYLGTGLAVVVLGLMGYLRYTPAPVKFRKLSSAPIYLAMFMLVLINSAMFIAA